MFNSTRRWLQAHDRHLTALTEMIEIQTATLDVMSVRIRELEGRLQMAEHDIEQLETRT